MQMVMGGAGAAATPPTWVDAAGGDLSSMRAFGNVNSFNFNDITERKIPRSEFGTPSAGDILVAMYTTGGYSGQSLAILYQGTTFTAWGNKPGVGVITADTSQTITALVVREASGDAEDDVRMGSPGPFPGACQVCRLSGNPFAYPGTLFADTDSRQLASDPDGAICGGGMFGGFNECIEFAISWKRGTATQVTNPLIGPSSIEVLGQADSIDNGFDQGLVTLWGINYSVDNTDAKIVDDCSGAGYTDRSFSVAARLKTGAS